MIDVGKTTHNFTGIGWREVIIKAPIRGVSNRTVRADIAYLIGDLTAGKLSLQSNLLSEETLGHLDKFLDNLEKDAAKLLFNVQDEVEEPVKPL